MIYKPHFEQSDWSDYYMYNHGRIIITYYLFIVRTGISHSGSTVLHSDLYWIKCIIFLLWFCFEINSDKRRARCWLGYVHEPALKAQLLYLGLAACAVLPVHTPETSLGRSDGGSYPGCLRVVQVSIYIRVHVAY